MGQKSKVVTLLSNPGMPSAYARWVFSKIFSGKPPRLNFLDDSNTSIGEWLTFSEYWSFQELVPDPEHLFVKSCLSDNSRDDVVAVDVGANIGIFTLFIASMGCPVHAFEPIPETFLRLKKNVKHNGMQGVAHLNCLAVGKEQGVVTFQVFEDAPAANRITSPNDRPSDSHTGTQVVSVVRLDDYCADQRIANIALLKIDVEGMEPYVIQGASDLFKQRRISAVLIEICPVNLHSAGFSCADLYREFETVSYSPYLLNADGTPGVKLSLKEIEAMTLTNIVLLPDA